MGRLSQELKTAIEEKQLIFAVAELDIGGTTQRYAGSWVASASLGLYKAQVIQNGFGTISQSVPIEVGGLQSAGTSVTIRDDSSLTLHKMMEGQYGRSIKGSEARIKIVSPAIDADKYYTAFTGEIDSFEQVQPRIWQFKIKPRDKPLKGIIKTPIISITDWPNAHGDAVGLRAPLVFGKHESTGTEAAGMVPTLYVDTSGYRYLLSVAKIKAVNDVFVNGATTSSGWSYTNSPKINGRTYSLIDFTEDQGDAVITADVDGVYWDGEYAVGSYTETNPANQLRIMLANFVFNEFQGGKFLDWNYKANPADKVAQIDYPSFERAAAFFDIHNITGSRVIEGGSQAGATINDWAATFQCAVYWTNQGKIGVAPDPFILTDIYEDIPWFTEKHCLDNPKYKYNTQILRDEIQANFLYSSADSKNFGAVRVKDTLRGWDVSKSIDLNWGLASII